MEIEYVPIVDEEDESLFSSRREHVHSEENPLWHRSATVLTFKTEERNQILVQRRSQEKERKPGLLEFTGGHVLSGESYREAAIRDYCEELMDRRPENTSIQDEDFQELERLDKKSPDNWEKTAVYSTVYDGPFDLSDEVEEAWYAPVEEVAHDLSENPDKYTNSAARSLETYLKEWETEEEPARMESRKTSPDPSEAYLREEDSNWRRNAKEIFEIL